MNTRRFPESAKPSPRTRRIFLWLFISMLSVSAIGFGAYYLLWADRIHPRLTLRGHVGKVYAVVFSPHGDALASGGEDGTVRLWDLATGHQTATLTGHTAEVYVLAYSKDGTLLASAGADKSVRVWDVSTGQLKATLVGHTEAVEALAFSPDGKTLLSGGDDKFIVAWDCNSSAKMSELPALPGNVFTAFAPDGHTLLVVNRLQIRLLEWPSGDVRMSIPQNLSLVSAAMPASGKILAAVNDSEGLITLWDVRTGKQQAILTPTRPSARGFVLACSPSGRILAANDGKTITLWDTENERELIDLTEYFTAPYSLAFSADGNWLAAGGQSSKIQVWDIAKIIAHLPSSPFSGPPKRSFDGSSSKFRQTVIIPTLDTPIPEGNSAIWCASFQVAWNQLKDKAGGPIEVAEAQPAADRLNRAKPSETDLPPGAYFAAAGFVKDGILERITTGLSKQFPQESPPVAAGLPEEIVAYSHLDAGVKFQYDFFDNLDWLTFRDATGKATPVRSFGLREQDRFKGVETYRDQVKVLFRSGNHYALDVSRNSTPNRLVLANIDRKTTLAEALADYQEQEAKGEKSQLSTKATLLIPNLDWRIEHHFKELEGASITNGSWRGLRIAQALQLLQFKLYRRGAEVKSSVDVRLFLDGHSEGDPDVFQFDRPFLIVLQKRDAKHPFFVMWVDNAELLCKQ